jgi:rod shape determining protein RodA
VFLLPVGFLIALQPDLGNALLYTFSLLCVLIAYGFPLRWFLLGSFPFLLASPLLWKFLHGYQQQRILTFVHPTNDPLGTSYNVTQAVIAVGSGKFIGRGLSEGTQSSLRFLPERHTDFIFATLSEGFGFVGSLVVIVAFVVILFIIYRIYEECDSQFGKLYALGVFFFFLLQFFVNIGMNIGLLPIVGVTLPFVSFGGSSILASFIMLGILSSISSQKKHQVLEIR